MKKLIDPTEIATPLRIQEAALTLFFERGFPATTMREIALACGLTAGALYNHFPSKERLLASIQWRVHRELENMLHDALARAGTDPRARLSELARVQALFHTNHTREARVANREIHWLPEPDRTEIIQLRRTTRGWFEDAIVDGQANGIFSVVDVKATVKAILNAGIGISDWFTPNGRMTADEIGDLHSHLALRMAGA